MRLGALVRVRKGRREGTQGRVSRVCAWTGMVWIVVPELNERWRRPKEAALGPFVAAELEVLATARRRRRSTDRADSGRSQSRRSRR